MRYMNDYEIQDRAVRYAQHPVLGPATRTLANLAAWANRNSDGWHMWPKPARAAEKLMALIEGDHLPDLSPYDRTYGEREDEPIELLRAALRPIKTFRTRQDAAMRDGGGIAGRDARCDFDICETLDDVRAQDEREDDLKRRAHIALAQQIANEYDVTITPGGEQDGS